MRDTDPRKASMSEKPVYPSVKQGVLLLVVSTALYLFAACVLILAAILFFMVLGSEVGEAVEIVGDDDAIIALTAVMNFLILGGTFYYGFKKAKAPLRTILPMKPVRPRLYWPMAAMTIGMGILLSQIDNFMTAFFEQILPDLAFEILIETEWTPDAASLWSFALLLMIVAPITEEPLFRGLLLRGFLAHRSRWKAVWISALLFGAFHMDIRQFLPAVAFGAALAWWRIETGSFLPALLGHAFYNGLAVVSTILHDAEALSGILQPYWLNAAGAFLFLSGLTSLRRHFRKPLIDDNDSERIPLPK